MQQQQQQQQPQYQQITGSSQKSRTVALILCLLGLIGLAGVHQFYVGKTIWGLVFFFTFGFLFLGTLISLFTIVLGNYKDNTGAPLRTW